MRSSSEDSDLTLICDRGFPNSLFAIFHSRQFFPLYLHLFIIATEVVLYNYVRLPPLLAIVLETCKLALPTKYLYSSLIHHRLGFFSSGYHPDWPFIRRIVTISAQKPVIYLALWLAVYNGLVYTLFVWAAAPRISSTEDEHSAESSSEHTISQFDFAEISWSHALHLVEWTSEGSKRSEPGIRGMGKWTIQHLLAYLKWIPRNIAIMTIVRWTVPHDLQFTDRVLSLGQNPAFLASNAYDSGEEAYDTETTSQRSIRTTGITHDQILRALRCRAGLVSRGLRNQFLQNVTLLRTYHRMDTVYTACTIVRRHRHP